MKLLNIKDMKIHYEKVEALKGISISMAEGSIVSIIGNNGAGKTTVLRGIFGFKKLSAGEVWFANSRIDGFSPREVAKTGIAYCMEGRRLFPQMTVLENLEMGGYLQAERKEIKKGLDEIWKIFPILDERRRQKAGTLSGGQQQMVAIGRALMGHPRLLLLDEPTLGLAPKIVQEIGMVIRNISQRGASILLVEQNSKLALGVAQRGYVLEVGRVLLDGDAKELLENEHVKRAYLGG